MLIRGRQRRQGGTGKTEKTRKTWKARETWRTEKIMKTETQGRPEECEEAVANDKIDAVLNRYA